MKKKCLLIAILGLISGFALMMNSNAAIARYNITRISNGEYFLHGNTSNIPVNIRLYEATIDGFKADTYCVDPQRKYGQDGSYTFDRYIDPTTGEPLDMAISAALLEMNKLKDEGVTGTNISLVGTIAMRWIFAKYTYQDCDIDCPGSPELVRDYFAFRDSSSALSVNGNTAIVAYARQVFEKAVNAVSTGSYDNAVAQGFIWAPKFNAVEYTETSISSNMRKVSFIIEAQDEYSTPSKFTEYIDGFTATCSNTSVKCTVDKKTARNEPAGIIIEMTIDTTNWNNQDFGITVNPAYCDAKDAAMQVALLRKTNTVQRMLAVLPGSCPATLTSTPRRPTRPGTSVYRDESCECNFNSNDEWDGTYTVTKTKDGYVTDKFTISKDETSKVNQYRCPPADHCKKPENNICKKPSESSDGKYHCTDGEECTEEEYIRECTHTCQTPEESGDGNYYCKESSPGAGDGKKCSETEYKAQCLNINCTPSVTMPSDCNDFNIESTEKGHISDINKTANSCNPTENQVKQCVINNKDITDSPFEATTEISNNPYCKIWCEEAFDFTLPTAKLSESGGYFTIETKVSGTRNCYVSGANDPTKGIDETKFNNDLDTAQKAVIDAWNEYEYWRKAAEKGATHDNDGCSVSGCSASESVYTKKWSFTIYDYDRNAHVVAIDRKYTAPNGTEYAGNYVSGTTAECSEGSSGTYNSITGTEEGGSPPSCDDGEAGDDPDSCAERNDDGTCKDVYHEDSRDEAKEILIKKINELNSIIIQYNNCTGAISNGVISDLISTAANSTGWDNDFNFSPTVTYNYNQDYIEKMSGTMEKKSSSGMNASYDYCTTDVDDQYNCPSSSTSSNIPDKSISVFSCDDEDCKSINITVSSAKWIKKTKKETATYRPDNYFSTYTQYGTIKFNQGNSYLYTELPDNALPISLITKSGVFPFAINYSDIGQSNSDNTKLGRLIGQSKSVLTEYKELPESLTCKDKDETMEQNIGYVCHYLNNCKGDCDFTCDDDNNCEFEGENCEDGICTLICENCIFDGEKNTYSYRTVSLNKLFPNGREDHIGYNWNSSIKGQITQREIEANSDTIYEKPEYSYTLTPNNLKNIRDYNDEVGSYTNTKTNDNNNALNCSNELANGVYYPVKCTSTFLDMLEGVENINYQFARYKNKYAQSENIVRPEYEDRFVLADQLTDSTGKLICQNFSCVSRTDYIGPAWK